MSLAVVALTWVTSLSLDIKVNYVLLLFIFFSSVTGYNFVKYAGVAGLHHKSLAASLRSIQIFSVVCGVGLLITVIQMPLHIWLACGILGLITLLYAVPFFLPKSDTNIDRGNLRSIGGLKIYIIGMVWSGVTVVLPVLESGVSSNGDFWIILLQRFLLVIALMIPFEIRDVNYDRLSLKTLPQVVGIKRSKIVGLVWGLLFFVLIFLHRDFTVDDVVSHLFVMVLLSASILLSKKQLSRYFASFWVEGIPLFWLVVMLLLSL